MCTFRMTEFGRRKVQSHELGDRKLWVWEWKEAGFMEPSQEEGEHGKDCPGL